MPDQQGDLGVGVANRNGDIAFYPCATAEEAGALARTMRAAFIGATVWVGLRSGMPPDQEGEPS